MIGHLYLEHLSDADLRFLSSASGEPDPGGSPQRIAGLLASPAVFDALFGGDPAELLLRVSPFLTFAVLVERVATDLAGAAFVQEWVGPRRTVPVFDVAELRDFLASASHRLFLAELLASYTRVASGSVWFRTARGWRRRRYSDLDPMRLAEMVELTPPGEHGHLLRRLGDLCLFLGGVFPDHAAGHPLEPRDLRRAGRLLGQEPPDELVLAGGGGLVQLEWLGRRAYRLAGQAGPAEGFGRARRVLNVAARTHLHAERGRWFGFPS